MKGFLMSISGRFFSMDLARSLRSDCGIETTERIELMTGEGRAIELLLLEIVEAMVARGALGREDVAGVLLRAAYGADIVDRVDEEDDGNFTGETSGYVELASAQWSDRLGLEPELYTLRKRHTDWLLAGSKGKAPLDPDEIVRFYRD